MGHYWDGDLTLAGGRLPHTWASDSARQGPRHALFIQFSRDFLGRELFEKPEFALVKDLLERSNRGLSFSGETKGKVAGMLMELEGHDGYSRVLDLLRILDILSKAPPSECVVLASEGYAPSIRDDDERRINKILDLIHKGICGEIRLDRMARALNMSRSTFIRFFHRATGRNLIEYVNEVRVGKACLLLVESELPVAEVCLKSGFASLPYFNRKFLELKGLTPLGYRKEFLGRRGLAMN